MNSNPLELTQAERLPDDLVAALERVRGELDRIGSPLIYFSTTGSTNDVAARLAEHGAADGTTVLADGQTAGRGRLGRTWFSPPGAGLYLSVVIRLGMLDRRKASPATKPGTGPIPLPSRLTLLAGVALAEAVRTTTGLPAEIKWPNDLVLGRRKLAGMLAEGAVQRGVLEYVILGVGINLMPSAFPPDIGDRAGALETELGRPVDRAALLAQLFVNLGRARTALRHDDVAPWFERWRGLSPSSNGALVEWRAPDGVRRGRTAGLDRDGALLVEANRGIERVVSGEVIWL